MRVKKAMRGIEWGFFAAEADAEFQFFFGGGGWKPGRLPLARLFIPDNCGGRDGKEKDKSSESTTGQEKKRVYTADCEFRRQIKMS